MVLSYFVIAAKFSHSVNLTDGLDGLAIMPTVMVSPALAIFAYVAGHAGFSKYLGLPTSSGRANSRCSAGRWPGPASVSCGSTPIRREVFMATSARWPWVRSGHRRGDRAPGDRAFHHGRSVRRRGSVGDGSGALLHGVTGGKRIFRMAPLHSLSIRCWKEPQWWFASINITIMLVLLGLSTLKLRDNDEYTAARQAGAGVGPGSPGLANGCPWLSCHARPARARARVADSRPAVLEVPNWKALSAPNVFSAPSMRPCSTTWMPWHQPGLDPRMPLVDRARSLGLAITGEMELLALDAARTGRAPADPHHRHHRHQRQDHHYRARRRYGPGRGLRTAVAGNISPAALAVLIDHSIAASPARSVGARAFQPPARNHVQPRSRCGDGAQRFGRSSRSLCGYRRIRCHQGADLSGRGRVMVLNRALVAAWRSGGRQRWFGTDAPRSADEYGLDSTMAANGAPARVVVALPAQMALAGACPHNALAALALVPRRSSCRGRCSRRCVNSGLAQGQGTGGAPCRRGFLRRSERHQCGVASVRRGLAPEGDC